MKTVCKIFYVTIAFGLLLVSSQSVNAQCNNQIKLVSIEDGQIEVSVTASGSYSCQLMKYENGEYVRVDTQRASGNKNVVFENVQKGIVYKVVANFSGADPLCSTRQLGGLKL